MRNSWDTLLTNSLRRASSRLVPEFLFRRRLEKQPRFDSGRTLPQQMADFEKQLIGQAISETRNLMDAARLLGISRQSLQYKLQKYQF